MALKTIYLNRYLLWLLWCLWSQIRNVLCSASQKRLKTINNISTLLLPTVCNPVLSSIHKISDFITLPWRCLNCYLFELSIMQDTIICLNFNLLVLHWLNNCNHSKDDIVVALFHWYWRMNNHHNINDNIDNISRVNHVLTFRG